MGHRLKVAVYVSGNLAASTLTLIVNVLRTLPQMDVLVLTNGNVFSREGLAKLEPFITIKDGLDLPKADLLLLAPIMSGAFEGLLSDAYRQMGGRILGVCSDLGMGPEKYINFAVLPDILAMPDPVSMKMYLDAGIPEANLRQVGSFYMDSIINESALISGQISRERSLAYLEVPNAWDWTRRNLPVYYSESEIHAAVQRATCRAGLKFTSRQHPRTLLNQSGATSGKGGSENPSLVQFLASNQIAVSTYSTTLLVAQVLGLSAISYQPNSSPTIRSQIFEHCKIPILQDEASFQSILIKMPRGYNDPAVPFWYSPGMGMDNLLTCIEELS